VSARSQTVENLSKLALFADLTGPELESVAHSLDEEVFAPRQRVLRQGLSGHGLYVIVDGEAAVELEGRELARLGRGDFFGELSLLTGERPMADVVAVSLLRCVVLAGPEVEEFLVRRPRVMFRMLQAVARRLRNVEQ
jgi:CRP-like cAMP-binding protein